MRIGSFEIKLTFSPRKIQYQELNLGISIVRFYLVAIDNDSNIQYRKLVGKQVGVSRKPHPELDDAVIDAARDPIENNVDKLLSENKSGNSVHDFFSGWEKIKAKYEEGTDPFSHEGDGLEYTNEG